MPRKSKRYTDPIHSLEAVMLPFTLLWRGIRYVYTKALGKKRK